MCALQYLKKYIFPDIFQFNKHYKTPTIKLCIALRGLLPESLRLGPIFPSTCTAGNLSCSGFL